MGSPIPAELLAEIAALRQHAGGLERHQRELTALLQAHEAITSSLDLEQSLRAIVDQAATIAGGSDTWLYVLDEERKTLRCRVSVSMSREEMDGLVMQVGEGIAGRIALNRAPLVIPDIRTHPHLWRPDLAATHRHVSYLGLPIMRGDQVLGVLAFSSPEPRTYAEAEVAFLTVFARQAAITIENARLYEAAQRELVERGRAEASLRESEVRYRRITAAVSDYIYNGAVGGGRTGGDVARAGLPGGDGIRQRGFFRRASGHVVTDADGGAAGIARLEETPVDLVFTDLGMPEVTGWDVARAVRARRPGLPIVLLTGWGEHGTGEAQPAGLVDRILGKPVRLEELLAVIDELTTVEPSADSRDATPES